MKKSNELYTAQQLRSLAIDAEGEKLEKLLERMNFGQTVVHNVRCNNLKSKLLYEAYDKALKGETSHGVNVTTFFESDEAADIPLIILQLEYELSRIGYKVSSDNHFSHVTLQSYDLLIIKW